MSLILIFPFYEPVRLAEDHGRLERAAFEASHPPTFFFDASYSSCTKLIADTAQKQFGFSDPKLDPLVRFADIIDSARFESPEQAIDRSDPLMRLVSVVEHYGDDGFYSLLVPELLQKSLTESNITRIPALKC